MATSEKSRSSKGPPPDLLPVIRASGILSDRAFAEIRGKVLAGTYPADPAALAERLVADRVLTEYQANRCLTNRPGGMVVGKYVILDRLGSGSMGRVYKAQHQLMGRVVALKIIAPEIASNQRAVQRFQREMRLVGRLDHPNVVRAFDADQQGLTLYIVMEFVPGRSLAQVLREGPLPPAEVVHYATQAALGLAHAHAQGIVHRDVKPSNLLLGEDRQLKVLDLGLGVLMEADDQATFATADGIAVGTIDYMSPEQACGKGVDGRSDLYSLGCAMYHLMTGQLAFPGSSPIERLGGRINGRPVPITEHRADLPSSTVAVIDRLMAHRPQDRFQTATEAAEALAALLRRPRRPASAALAPSPSPAPAASAPPARRAAPPGGGPGGSRAGATPRGSGSSKETAPSLPVMGRGEPVPEIVESPPPPTRVTVRPAYPGWFRPLAGLAETRPALALIAVLAGLSAAFAAGFAAAWLAG